MKNGKLEQSDVGKKFRRPEDLDDEWFFLLLAISSDGSLLGEWSTGEGAALSRGFKDWLPYEPPKQKHRIEAAPAVVLHITGEKGFTRILTEEEAKVNWGDRLIHWPASWDPVKGVWFYEWEEKCTE